MRSHDAAAACILNAGTVGLSIRGSVVKCQWGRGKRRLTDARQRFPPDPRTSCWFCLAAPELEEHLLVLSPKCKLLIAHIIMHANDLSLIYLLNPLRYPLVMNRIWLCPRGGWFPSMHSLCPLHIPKVVRMHHRKPWRKLKALKQACEGCTVQMEWK